LEHGKQFQEVSNLECMAYSSKHTAEHVREEEAEESPWAKIFQFL